MKKGKEQEEGMKKKGWIKSYWKKYQKKPWQSMKKLKREGRNSK